MLSSFLFEIEALIGETREGLPGKILYADDLTLVAKGMKSKSLELAKSTESLKKV